jgi:hypothetical protein
VADMQLDLDLWYDDQKISLEDNEFLTRPFSLEELDLTMKDMKNNTAPGPDGFSVEFFKSFWPLIRDDVWSYGVVILLPKVKPALNIKQFRPICLLNVIYKIITKH